MLPALKLKFDLYFDSALNVTNQLLNSPKTAPASAVGGMGISLADVDVAIGIIGGLFALVVGAASLWVMIEKRVDDIRSRRKRREIEKQELILQKLKTKSLENHIKKQAGS